MINGRFVCIGNTPYLKNKYGKGYKITLSKGPKFVGDMEIFIKEISERAKFLDDDGSDVYETYQVIIGEGDSQLTIIIHRFQAKTLCSARHLRAWKR